MLLRWKKMGGCNTFGSNSVASGVSVGSKVTHASGRPSGVSSSAYSSFWSFVPPPIPPFSYNQTVNEPLRIARQSQYKLG